MIELNWQLLLTQAITFIIGVTILWKIAWKPLTARLTLRQSEIRKNLEKAEEERLQMENLKKEYQIRLEEIEKKAHQLFNQSVKEGQAGQEAIIRQAREEAKQLLKFTHEQLIKEKEIMLGQLKNEIANIAILATEKLVQHSLDRKVQESLLENFFQDLEKKGEP
ncbi:MAG: F0F1 ATP synthase subunit B [Elusimicrobiota bacterium]